MKKIGLLSDTHSHIDDKMIRFLESVDEIWHVGDIGDFKVIEILRGIAPVKAVFGNIDSNELRQEFSEVEQFTIEKVPVFMTHIGGYPDKYVPGIKAQLIENNVKLFISGHSHILKVIYDKELNCLHINPGASGIYGLHRLRTMVRFNIDNSDIKNLEVWEHKR